MILSPKTEEEKQNLINKGFIPPDNKSKWKFKININPIVKEYLINRSTNEFRDSLENLLINNYDNIKLYCIQNYNGELIKQIDTLIEALQKLNPIPEINELDKFLLKFYDICYNHNIWVESDEV
jgi:hypothetical protein